MAAVVSRDRVLAAARRLCADGRQPTMMELAEHAGSVGVRTLYRLFGSRQALLREAGCLPAPTPRQRILEAALNDVGRRGLAELSMDDLAARAGVSRATLYRLFPGKSALFDALILEFSPWEPVADVIDAMADRPPEAVIPAVAQAISDSMDGRVELLLRIVSELSRGEPDTAEGLRHSMARGLPDLVGYITHQMQSGRLRPMHPIIALQLLAGPIAVHLLTRPLAELMGDFNQSTAETLDEIVHAWLRAMRPSDD